MTAGLTGKILCYAFFNRKHILPLLHSVKKKKHVQCMFM